MKKKKFKQIQNQAQEGRSMVEMLGVLAIIGVLSVGSLSGYEYATASYRAGQIRDALLTAKKSASVNTSASHANEVKRLLKGYLSEYSVNVEADSEGQHPYQVQLKGVAPRTCAHLWEMQNVLDSFSIKMTSPTSKNGCQLNNASVDTVSMSFEFNALDNKTDDGSGESSCAGCSSEFCIGGVCVECRTSADCPADQVCDERTGQCTEDCSKGVCQTGHCINHRCGECEEPTPKWNGKNCVACPPSAPQWNGVDCEACPSNKPKWTDEGCVECPDGTTWDGVDCVAIQPETTTPSCTPESCSGETPICNTSSGVCEACTADSQCGTGKHCKTDGSCVTCSGSTPYWNGSTKQCVACTGNSHCSGTTPICNTSTGVCGKCTSDTSCGTGKHCKTDGSCVTCSGTTPYWNATKKQCVACSGTTPYWNATKKQCVACTGNSHCSGTTPICNTSTGVCGKCTSDAQCGTDKHCKTDGSCVTCTGTTPYWNKVKNTCVSYECRNNADCNPNGGNDYYCYMRNGYGYSVEFKDGSSSRTTGKCRLVSSDLTKEAKINGTTYYGSGKDMTWWSACRLCAARANKPDSVCTSPTTAEPSFMGGWGDPDFKCAHKINPGTSGDWGFCHANQDDGKTSKSSSNVSETIVALRKMYNSSSYFLWLRNNQSSSNAYYVDLTSGRVDTNTREGYGYDITNLNVLCR